MLIALLCGLVWAGNPEVTDNGPDGRGVMQAPEAGPSPASDGLGELVVQAEVPIEVAVDGRPVAQIFMPSSVHIPVRVGSRKVTVMVNGNPTKLVLDVPDSGNAHVIVGRTGITTRTDAAAPAATEARVDLRVVGKEGIRVTIDGQRFRLSPGQQQALELTSGDHAFELRSSDGTAIFAVGDLMVHGSGDVVVQLSAGRAPEVIGQTGSWQPSSR